MSQQLFIPTPKFEEYKERFKEFYKMQRRADGVILVEAHTNGGPIQLSVENHRSVGQMLKIVGADPENEIMIFTGSGDEFMMDARRFQIGGGGSAVLGLRVRLQGWPHQRQFNGQRSRNSDDWGDQWSGFHTEMLLMCDITICSEDAIIYDLHYDIGSVPGDGIHSCFQELLGVKRAAYALLTGQTIDAKTALEYGMVNEIHPREKLIERAYKLADHIMTQTRTTRRMTTQIVRRPWRRQITDSLDGGFAMQMFAHLAKNTAAHGRSHIGDAVAYVRKGKRNNFD